MHASVWSRLVPVEQLEVGLRRGVAFLVGQAVAVVVVELIDRAARGSYPDHAQLAGDAVFGDDVAVGLEIGRAHVRTLVSHAHPVFRLQLDKKTQHETAPSYL